MPDTSLPYLLVVDDDVAHADTVARVLTRAGYTTRVAHGGHDAIAAVRAERPALVLTDLVMPDLGGLDLLRALKHLEPDLDVLLMTAFGTVERAVEAMQAGASDFIVKPIDRAALLDSVARHMQRHELRIENARLRAALDEATAPSGIIGASAPLRRALGSAHQAAASDATVLLLGESGTGKELFAREIHRTSPRARGPFLAVHLAALPESVIESELFGHEAGAFTGARGRRAGCFESANGGTLFLDEIGELSPAVQVRLLRVLEGGELVRVGGNRPVPIDVRVIAATHRDLPALVREGRFREDLWYRLHVVPIELPPLRERRDDIPALVRFALRGQSPRPTVTAEALEALGQWDWPGNIRELLNVLERAIVLDRDGRIDIDDLPAPIARRRPTPSAPLAPGQPPALLLPIGTRLADAERALILATLDAAGGDKQRAARMLGIGRRTIYRKLDEWREPTTHGADEDDE